MEPPEAAAAEGAVDAAAEPQPAEPATAAPSTQTGSEPAASLASGTLPLTGEEEEEDDVEDAEESPYVRSRTGTNPAEVVIRSFVEALARLARSHRDAVREAGGISPLVTLLRSGSPEVQALTAAVLRDLALDNTTNRAAILKAGGLLELIEMVRKDASKPAAGEAAGALRSLSNGYQLACTAIIESRGVEALVAMVAQGEAGSTPAIHATGVLANLARGDVSNCDAILRAGGIAQLVKLLSKGHEREDTARRRLPTELKHRLERAAEEAANALWQLAAKVPACNIAIREAQASDGPALPPTRRPESTHGAPRARRPGACMRPGGQRTLLGAQCSFSGFGVDHLSHAPATGHACARRRLAPSLRPYCVRGCTRPPRTTLRAVSSSWSSATSHRRCRH